MNNVTVSQETLLKRVVESDTKTARALHLIADTLIHRQNRDNVDVYYALISELYGLRKMSANLLALLCSGIDYLDTREHLIVSPDVFHELVLELARCGILHMNEQDVFTPGAVFLTSVLEGLPMAEIAERDGPAAILEMFRTLDEEDGREAVPMFFIGGTESDEHEPKPGFPVMARERSRPARPRRILMKADNVLRAYRCSSMAGAISSLTEGLNADERAALFLLMGRFVKEFCTPASIKSFSPADQGLIEKNANSLIARELVVNRYVFIPGRDKENGSKSYVISPKCAEVFHGHDEIVNEGVVSDFGALYKSGSITPKKLFFPEQDYPAMERIRKVLGREEAPRIISGLEKKGLRPCISVLMYGPPGTGKTELAKQAARESGRTVFVCDTAKMHGIYIGEAAINFRNCFQTYRYLHAVCSSVPLFLMDEVDGIFGKRNTDVHLSGKDHNSAMAVFLEEMNTLPGIVIATSNLVQNLDEAAQRRFSVHVAFHLPDPSTAARIWLYKFPSLTPDEAEELAENYTLSGGVIDNVASIALMDEIIDGKEVTAEDLAAYCEMQVCKRSRRARIGF